MLELIISKIVSNSLFGKVNKYTVLFDKVFESIFPPYLYIKFLN